MLGLPGDADWEAVCRALRQGATESLARLIGDYETAARALAAAGPAAELAEAVKAAKSRLKAYAAYLDEKHRTLETAAARITGELLARLRAPE